VSALLRDTCKTLFPRMRLRYTLHSPRSQFIANVASVCDAAVAAALAGEICGHEQRLYYTHAKPAWSRESMPDLPKPDPQLLAHMKERVEWYNLRIEARYGPRRTRAKAALPD
jgi:hypothetical protein